MAATLPRTPSFDLGEQRAVITGASRGIGLAAAAALAQAGAEVTLISRTRSEVEAAAAELSAAGASAFAACLDVTDLGAVRCFFAAQEPFDILVNNAGSNRPKPLTEVTEEDFDAILDLNLKSAFFVAQACAKRMIEDHISGSLIHISSQMGHVGAPNRSLYCASKWAVEGMSKSFALELAKYGIRSNTVAPTFIETPLTKPFFEVASFKDKVLKKIKLGRIGKVEDLMGAIVFLASEASSLMTGSTMMIDGGWTAD